MRRDDRPYPTFQPGSVQLWYVGTLEQALAAGEQWAGQAQVDNGWMTYTIAETDPTYLDANPPESGHWHKPVPHALHEMGLTGLLFGTHYQYDDEVDAYQQIAEHHGMRHVYALPGEQPVELIDEGMHKGRLRIDAWPFRLCGWRPIESGTGYLPTEPPREQWQIAQEQERMERLLDPNTQQARWRRSR